MDNNVIITADDFGICNRIDNGIIKGVKAGYVTAVSAVVTHDTSSERIKKLLNLQKEEIDKDNEFGIGLHFSLTTGKPIYKPGGLPSSLADPENADYFRDAHFYEFNDVQSHHLREELNMQLEKLADLIGKENIDHITNHQGLVYFDKRFFNEYAQTAATWNIPMRSPMSWYRKFKKVGSLPDFDNKPFGNPIMRRGLSNGAWRKFAQMSYGNVLKRIQICEELDVPYPDVLCEYIYGQCAEDIAKGNEVLSHVLNKYHPGDNWRNLGNSNRLTLKQARKGDLALVGDKYQSVINRKAFAMELMFHLGDNGELVDELKGIENNDAPHGVNTEYYSTRDRELKCLKTFNWEDYAKVNKIDFIPFRKM